MDTSAKPEVIEHEFNGDQCMVLPTDFLESALAVSEIHADELASVRGTFEIDQLTTPGFFHGTAVAVLLWVTPSLWTVCF